ncbi:hypothetical protein BC937DRAFT_91212, partial [Endogone sp. FLAS-F59071]
FGRSRQARVCFFPPKFIQNSPRRTRNSLVFLTSSLMGQTASKLERVRSIRAGGSPRRSESNRSSNGSYRGGSRYNGLQLSDMIVKSQHDEFSSQGTTDYSKFEWVNNATEDSSYFLPSPGNDAENDRLTKQHIMLKAVFDGCGSATWIMEIAVDYPNAECHGIDICTTFPYSSSPGNVTFQTVDVCRGIPFENETFDFVHMRLFSLALSVSDWPRVIAELFRITKKDGVVQLVELDLRFSTSDPELKSYINAAVQTLSHMGKSPSIALELPELVSGAGFKILQTKKRSVPLGSSEPISQIMLDDWERAAHAVKHVVAPSLAISEQEVGHLIDKVAAQFSLAATQSHANWYSVVGQRPRDAPILREPPKERWTFGGR